MSRQTFDEDCPGCRPALIDTETMEKMDDDSPAMLVVLKVWADTHLEERKAFHRVCCLNSRNPQDVMLFQGLTKKMETALKEAKLP
jgi:hypothetical protein